jgi:5-methylcytosine-specific restriction endonuclease McrA
MARQCLTCDGPINRGKGYPDQWCATLDHKVPLSHGGSHTYSNVQLAHAFCNITKGAGTVDKSALRERVILRMIFGELKYLVGEGV